MSQHPNMTRRHFEMLAELVVTLPDDTAHLMSLKTGRPVNVRRLVAEHMVNFLQVDNKHFREAVFLAACGLD